MIGLKNHLQQYEQSHKTMDSTNNASLQLLQQELTKRSEQVYTPCFDYTPLFKPQPLTTPQ